MPAHHALAALTPPQLDAPLDPVVALVDDDPLYIEYVTGLLAMEGVTRVRAIDARAPLFPRLHDVEADCLVIDYDLGHDNGLNVAERVLAERPDAPALVMMTGTGSERTVIKAMRLGFHDYVSKRSLTGPEMVRAVHRAIASRRPAATVMAGDAMHAPTGLPGRARVAAALEELCGIGSRRPFAFGLLEPNLADVTAQLGLAAGHRAREGFVHALRGGLDRGLGRALVGHWEGDRFAWIWDEAATPAAFDAAMAALPGALERTVVTDGAWARVPACAGAVLLPTGRHDAGAVVADATALIESARETGRPERHAVRGRHAAVTAADDAPSASNEKRAARRMRCLKLARVILPGDRAVVDCVAVNLSANGACLKAKSFFVAPDSFAVEIVGSGERRPARVAWQRGPVMGVEFTDAGAPRAAPAPGTVH